MPGVYKAPMVRMFSGERELTKLRMKGSIDTRMETYAGEQPLMRWSRTDLSRRKQKHSRNPRHK